MTREMTNKIRQDFSKQLLHYLGSKGNKLNQDNLLLAKTFVHKTLFIWFALQKFFITP